MTHLLCLWEVLALIPGLKSQYYSQSFCAFLCSSRVMLLWYQELCHEPSPFTVILPFGTIKSIKFRKGYYVNQETSVKAKC